MEKILKKILIIPLLIILLNIKNVYADSYNIYMNSPSFFSSTSQSNLTYLEPYNFNIFDTDFNYYINNSYNKINFVIYYFKDIKEYLLLSFNAPNNLSVSSTDKSVNLINTISGNSNYCIEYLDSNNNKQNICPNTLKIGQLFVTKTYYRGNYSSNVSWAYANVFSVDNSPFTYVYSSSASNNNTINYLLNHPDNVELVYVNSNNFSINGIIQGSALPEEPDDPIPEEPETPSIPPYNFSNNKYYVPNYHEGQCVEVIDKDTIRVFEDEQTDFYIDYYINSNYISRQGQVDLDYIKQCSNLEFTDIRYYGNDMPQILFILVCVLTFTIGFPYILYKRFRKR